MSFIQAGNEYGTKFIYLYIKEPILNSFVIFTIRES